MAVYTYDIPKQIQTFMGNRYGSQIKNLGAD